MRILQIITRSEPGGAQAVVANLAAELALRGHELIVASGPEGGGAAWKGLDPSIAIREIPGLVRDISPAAEWRALRNLSAAYRELRPDIVHLHTSKAGALGRLAGGIEVGRIVYTMHGYFQVKDLNRKFLLVDRALRGRCGAVVAVSDNDRRLMEADGYRVRLIPNGVPDVRRLEPRDPEVAARLSALRATGLPLAMLVARDASFKRIDLAREAARGLQGLLSVAWIGGEPRPEIDPPNFFAFGAIPGGPSYLGLADIFFLPSDHEGMSMSLLEAFSAGLPCVASAVGGNLELLGVSGAGESERGACVENRAEAFVEALGRLARDGGRRQATGIAARAAWEREYSAKAMALSHEKLYRELLG